MRLKARYSTLKIISIIVLQTFCLTQLGFAAQLNISKNLRQTEPAQAAGNVTAQAIGEEMQGKTLTAFGDAINNTITTGNARYSIDRVIYDYRQWEYAFNGYELTLQHKANTIAGLLMREFKGFRGSPRELIAPIVEIICEDENIQVLPDELTANITHALEEVNGFSPCGARVSQLILSGRFETEADLESTAFAIVLVALDAAKRNGAALKDERTNELQNSAWALTTILGYRAYRFTSNTPAAEIIREVSEIAVNNNLVQPMQPAQSVILHVMKRGIDGKLYPHWVELHNKGNQLLINDNGIETAFENFTKSAELTGVALLPPAVNTDNNRIIEIAELDSLNVIGSCGIMAYFGNNSSPVSKVLEAAILLGYRAPDSTGLGMAVSPDGRIALRRELGKAQSLSAHIYKNPFYPKPPARSPEETTAARMKILRLEGVIKDTSATLPNSNRVSCTIDDLYVNRRPTFSIGAGNYGEYNAARSYTIDTELRAVADIMRDYGVSSELVKYFVREVFSQELDRRLSGQSDAKKKKKLLLGEFDKIFDRKFANKITRHEDIEIWGRISQILDGLQVEMTADFDLDPVRHAFRVLSASLVSQFNIDPSLRRQVQNTFNARLRAAGVTTSMNWQDMWKQECELNVVGLAFESLVEWYQSSLPAPNRMYIQEAKGSLGRLGATTLGLLPIILNGHGRWGMCGGITVNNAHPHLDPEQIRALELNGSLRMDTYSHLRAEQNIWLERRLDEAQKEAILRENAESAALEKYRDKDVMPDERQRFIEQHIRENRHRMEWHRSENDTEVLVYEWAKMYALVMGDRALRLELMKTEPDILTHLRKLIESGASPDEIALRLALIRNRDGSEMGVDTLSLHNPRVKYIASHNRPVAIVEHNGQIMVSSDQNAALGLWSPEEIQTALSEIYMIRERRRTAIATLDAQKGSEEISEGIYTQQKREVDDIARRQEAEVLKRFEANVIYLDGQDNFAKLYKEIDTEGRVVTRIEVTSFDGQPRPFEWKKAVINPAQAGKGDNPTFLLHHIKEIPDILERNASDYISERGAVTLDSMIDESGNILKKGLNIENLKRKFGSNLEGLKRIFLVGVGSSYRDALAAQRCFEAILPGVEVIVYDPVEMLNQGIEVNPETDLGIAITWSGSTASAIKAVEYMQNKGAICTTVTGKIQSDLARKTERDGGAVDVQSGPEISVCTVKGFESILYMLDLLAVQINQTMYGVNGSAKGPTAAIAKTMIHQLQRTIPQVAKVEMELATSQETISRIAGKYAKRNKVLVIGSSPITQEAELKFEEVLWIAGAAYDLSDERFWPDIEFPKLNPDDSPVVIVNATDEARMQEAVALIKKLRDKGVNVVVQTYEGSHVETLRQYGVEDIYLTTEVHPVLQDLVDASFFFRLVHEMAMQKGMSDYDIDNCRNLAKSVTVSGAEQEEQIKKQAGQLEPLTVQAFTEQEPLEEAMAAQEPLTSVLSNLVRSLMPDNNTLNLADIQASRIQEVFDGNLQNLKNIVIVADSEPAYNAALSARNYFRSVLGRNVTVIRSNENLNTKISDKNKTLVVTITESEESALMPGVCQFLHDQGILNIAIAPQSSMLYQSRISSGGAIDMPLGLNEFQRYSVSNLNLMVLALKLAELNGKETTTDIQCLRRMPQVVSQALTNQGVGESMARTMDYAQLYDKVHVLGGGYAFADAQEWSRLLSLQGIHAEAQLNDSAWHGPLAAVDPDKEKFADADNKTGVNHEFDTKGDTLVLGLGTDSRFYSSTLLDSQVYNTREGRITLFMQKKHSQLPVVQTVGASEVIPAVEVPDMLSSFVSAAVAQRFAIEYGKTIRARFVHQVCTPEKFAQANTATINSAFTYLLNEAAYGAYTAQELQQAIQEQRAPGELKGIIAQLIESKQIQNQQVREILTPVAAGATGTYEIVGVNGIRMLKATILSKPVMIGDIAIDPTKNGTFKKDGTITIGTGVWIKGRARLEGPGVIDNNAAVGGYISGSYEMPFIIGHDAVVHGEGLNVGETIVGPGCVVNGARTRKVVLGRFSFVGTGSILEDESGKGNISVLDNTTVGTNVRVRRNNILDTVNVSNAGEVKSDTLIGAGKDASVELPHIGYIGSTIATSIIADNKDQYKKGLLALLVGKILKDEPLEQKGGYVSSSGLLRQITIEMPDGEIVIIKAQRINFGAGAITSDYDPLTGIKAGAIIDGGGFVGAHGALKAPVWIGEKSGVGNLSQAELDEAEPVGTIVIGLTKGKVVIEAYRTEEKGYRLSSDLHMAVKIQLEYFERLVTMAEVYAEAAKYAKDPYELVSYLAKLQVIKGQFDELGSRYGKVLGPALYASIETLRQELIAETDTNRQERLINRITDQETVRAEKDKILSDLHKIQTTINNAYEQISAQVSYASTANAVREQILHPEISWVNPLQAGMARAAGAIANANGDYEGKIIGTDGMRGRIFETKQAAIWALQRQGTTVDDTITNSDLMIKFGILTRDIAVAHGMAYVRTFGKNMPFSIAGDNRPETIMLAKAVAEGIRSQGGNVEIVTIPVSTPALAYRSKIKNCIGIGITGSHLLNILDPANNRYPENGIKGFLNGEKLPDENTLELEKNTYDIASGDITPITSTAGQLITIDTPESAYGEYVDHIAVQVQAEFGMKPLEGKRYVLDTANGASTMISQMVFDRLGAKVVTINGSPDGRIINLQEGNRSDENGKPILSGSQDTRRLADEVLRFSADGGAGFDGDADRVKIIAENGIEGDGDVNLGVIALCMNENPDAAKRLKGNTVVGTTMTTVGLRRALQKAGINFVPAKVGDRYINDELNKNGQQYELGGEQSGHTILRRWQTTGDGILTACMLFAHAAKRNIPLSALTSRIDNSAPYLGPDQDIDAGTPEIANRVIAKLDEASREQNLYYHDIMKIIKRDFIDSGLAHYYTVAASKDGNVKAKELYVELWDKQGIIVGWISIRQSGTRPKEIRTYLNVLCNKETAVNARNELVQRTEKELASASAIGLPEAALVIGPDGIQRLETVVTLTPKFGRPNIFEALDTAAAIGMLDKIKETHTISLVVNATGNNTISSALANRIGKAKIIIISPSENAEQALQDV